VGNSITPYEQRAANGRKGGIRSNSPERLAMRLVQNWPEFTQTQQDVIRGMLRPVLAPRRTPKSGAA
jgi:hypothetical protein